MIRSDRYSYTRYPVSRVTIVEKAIPHGIHKRVVRDLSDRLSYVKSSDLRVSQQPYPLDIIMALNMSIGIHTKTLKIRSKGTKTDISLAATAFFLGIIFSLFPYDYPLLWSPSPTPASHYDYLEAHLKFLHASPPLIPRILHIVIAIGLIGLLMKLYRPSESNMLFDGASLVLYMCGVIVYIANIVKGLRIVTAGDYGAKVAEEASDQILGQGRTV
ncbi:conserved hypothetical protein [Uncinocarpus reesii 1704]|uniref:Uncharacterized protein n=1 Tax=Uncinocarpus reesii (strain UAMH 1704) TaxID=336963 RepID=C4JET7_UNCRE|nr:uncharacterized protein UREG_02247 [Uncinocarpus reesii 1704]EEP77398.1 conserved hypothetical protein [Uncinocarpus reesii 1704]